MDKFNIKVVELKKKYSLNPEYNSPKKKSFKKRIKSPKIKKKQRNLKIEIKNSLKNTLNNKEYWEENFFLPQTTRQFSGYSSLSIKEKKLKLKTKLYSTIRNSINKVNSDLKKNYRKSLNNRRNNKFEIFNQKNKKINFVKEKEKIKILKKKNIYDVYKLHNKNRSINELKKKPSFKDDFEKIINKYKKLSKNENISKGSLINDKNKHFRNISVDVKKNNFRRSCLSNKTARVSKRTSISNKRNMNLDNKKNIYKNFVKRKIDFLVKNNDNDKEGIILKKILVKNEKNDFKNYSKRKNDLNLNVNLNVKLDQKIINFKSKINKLFLKNCNTTLNSYSNNIYKKISRENISKNNSRSFLNYKRDIKKNKSIIIKKNKQNSKINKKITNNYLIKDLIISINNYLLKNKKDKYITFLKKTYQKLQKLKKYNLVNHKFIFSLNLNINLLKHKIEKKRYLILDLDETLIFSSRRKISSKSIFIEKNVYLNKRPYLKEFLNNVSKRFNLILFTASEKSYAEKILRFIDKKNNFFMLKFFRKDCVILPGNLILKNLEFLQNFKEKNLAIIDNSVNHFFKNLNNCIPIVPFFGDVKDMELIYLDNFLKEICKAKDFRKIFKESFGLKNFLSGAKFDVCLKNFLDNKKSLFE